MTASALDSVRGLGENRRKALVTHFGSVARLKQASVEEITAVPGIGVTTATAVLEALGVRPDSTGSAADSPPMDDDQQRDPAEQVDARSGSTAERASG
jgi:excinuclease ABC subunit C